MKFMAALLIIVTIVFTACSGSPESMQDEPMVKDQGSTVGEEVISGETVDDLPTDDEIPDVNLMEQLPTESDLAGEAECYPEGIHPIGDSIADQFHEITTYQEVMNWFCSGAEFEDILNALVTEELSEIDAENFLKMIADGNTWDDIWLELGITEQ
jgi:hypothetical protein